MTFFLICRGATSPRCMHFAVTDDVPQTMFNIIDGILLYQDDNVLLRLGRNLKRAWLGRIVRLRRWQ